MKQMTPWEIEEYIEEQCKNPQIQQLLQVLDMTKDQWIEAAIRSEKKFMRCENCSLWECEYITSLRPKYDAFIKVWYEYGTTCEFFNPTEDAKL